MKKGIILDPNGKQLKDIYGNKIKLIITKGDELAIQHTEFDGSRDRKKYLFLNSVALDLLRERLNS